MYTGVGAPPARWSYDGDLYFTKTHQRQSRWRVIGELLTSITSEYLPNCHLRLIEQLLGCCWRVFSSIQVLHQCFRYSSILFIEQLLGGFWCVELISLQQYLHNTHQHFIVELLRSCWCVFFFINFTSISPLFSSNFYCVVIGVL